MKKSNVKRFVAAGVALLGTAGAGIGAVVTAPIASACSGVANGGGGAFGSGGSVSESCLPDGSKYHCETVMVLGFGGTNCFVIPVGDPRNPT